MNIFKPLQYFYFSAINGYHTGKGSNCLRKKDVEKGLYHLNQALVYSEKTQNLANIAFSHEVLGDAFLCAEKYDLAIYHAEQSCKIYEEFTANNSSDIFKQRLKKVKSKLTKIKFQSSLRD